MGKFWKKVWNAPIHNRVKEFLWRIFRRILPTKTNLQQKEFLWKVFLVGNLILMPTAWLVWVEDYELGPGLIVFLMYK